LRLSPAEGASDPTTEEIRVNPVSPERIEIAMLHGLHNVPTMALACREAEVPFFVACALFEKESKGKPVWGNDEGGVFKELPDDDPAFYVTKATFKIFEYYVFDLGRTSNGVGPAQITWKGFFPDMKAKGLKPWNIHHNMLYGLQLLHDYKNVHGATWEDAGTKYNGAKSYGVDFAAKVREWKQRFEA
jgi:hypothetical protein